jgi:non-specific serine/threonine protein kinase
LAVAVPLGGGAADQMEVTLDGERLTAAEIKKAARQSDGLHLRGRSWVERIWPGMLDQFEASGRRREAGSAAEAMRLVAGANVSGDWPSTKRRTGRAVAGP